MATAKPHEETVFEAALEVADPAARGDFLDRACAGDPGLRNRMEKLLAAHVKAEKFFAECAPALDPIREGSMIAGGSGSSSPLPPVEEEQLSSKIGPYKLLQKIGEGGCGVVYMAEQEKPIRRRVALKVIKLGMDTKSVIARFEAERQALARMDHSNIARVLDAGATEKGRPYFVMELVHGVKITEYCDQNHVNTRQRLDLFIQICHAIQHAHQKGIIHRDIKPSNILVTLHDGVPVPKVIDFGIAKATEEPLTDRTLFTVYGHFIGTPAYMSPERAELSGLDVDTRSDIYSLGVLLYELLTGRTPFDGRELMRSGIDEMRRTLREKEPQRPSTMVTTLHGTELTALAEHRQVEPPRLMSLLRGDLDWIVMKALEKDRTRRYETANGLAMDIQRHLNHEPVVARPPSRLYRFQKLVHRNKVVFVAAGAVAAALIAGLGTSTWLFLKEREARHRAVAAEQQQARLRAESENREKITEAALLVSADKFDEADKLAHDISFDRASVDGAAVLRSLAEWHALQSEWQAAAGQFDDLLAIDQLDSWDVRTLDYLECGVALIEQNDAGAYERFRRAIIESVTGTQNQFADRVVKISLLRPADDATTADLSRMSEITARLVAANSKPSGDTFMAAWGCVSLGLMEYRQQDYVKSIEWCRQCLAYQESNAPRSAAAHIILAMSCARLHQDEEARAELAQGRKLVETKIESGLDRGTGVQGFWFDWVFARILLREATALIENHPETPTVPPQSW